MSRYNYSDPDVDKILGVLSIMESGGDYGVYNKQGEPSYGKFQFMPDTWRLWSSKMTRDLLGKPIYLSPTPDNQELVARYKVTTLLNSGNSPEQIASIWNTGSPEWSGKVGVNRYGNRYDAPAYVAKFNSLLSKAKGFVNPSEAYAAEIPNQASTSNEWEIDESWKPTKQQATPTHKLSVNENNADNEWEIDESWVPDNQNKTHIDYTGMQDSSPYGVDLKEAGTGMLKEAAPVIGPVLPFAGSMIGGAIAAPANLIAPGVAEVAGATGGYLAGKQAENRLYELAGIKPSGSLADAVKEVAGDIPEAGITAASGPVGGKILEGAASLVGKGVRPILGSITGKGTGAIEEALKSGTSTGLSGNPLKSTTDFDKALRGHITSQEVVENAKLALNTIKDQRGEAYRELLEQIGKNGSKIDVTPIGQALLRQMKKFNVKVTPTGDVDYSRIAMGKSGRRDIEEIVEKVRNWGSQPDDFTPIGLDTLKRQLDDFWSESSQARAFVTSLRNSVKDTIVKNVPEYAEMTKGYAEATSLIKDIESGLMLRKQGMSGRMTADQTLRRLNSAMRDNFALRRDLVNAMSAQTGEDLGGQIAGQAMNDALPSGLARIGAAGLGAAEMLRLIDPHYISILAVSSPRVQGEFLRLYGKGLAELKGTAPVTSRAATAAYESSKD